MGLYEIESAARRIDAASVQLSRCFYLHIPAARIDRLHVICALYEKRMIRYLGDGAKYFQVYKSPAIVCNYCNFVYWFLAGNLNPEIVFVTPF